MEVYVLQVLVQREEVDQRFTNHLQLIELRQSLDGLEPVIVYEVDQPFETQLLVLN